MEARPNSSEKSNFHENILNMKARYSFFVVLLMILSYNLVAQNMVPNPSFENLDQPMPCDFVGSSLQFNNMIQDWTAPTEGSPDLHSKTNPTNCWSHCTAANIYTGSTCFRGPQDPHHSHIMCGIQLYKPTVNCSPWMEYIQVELTTPMVAGVDYYASMWVSLSDYSPIAVDKLGMYFTTNAISQPSGCPNLVGIPQVAATSVLTDVINWVKLEGTFTASAAYQYLTIGNFDVANVTAVNTGGSCNAQGAYYYIDDVLVIEDAQLGIEQHMTSSFSIAGSIVDDQLIISPETNLTEIEFMIIDVSGRVLDQFSLTEKTYKDVTSLTPGMYFLRTTDTSNDVIRFIKI